MKTIFFPEMHNTLHLSFAKAFEMLDIQMLIGDSSFNRVIPYYTYGVHDLKNMPENVKYISYKELINDPPDMFMINCTEILESVYKNIYPYISHKTKFIHYSGNDNTGIFYHQWSNMIPVTDIIVTDIMSYNFFKSVGNVNIIKYKPWIDYDMFNNSTPFLDPIVYSYFTPNYVFANGFKLMLSYLKAIPFVIHQNVNGVDKKTTSFLMANSSLTMHFKSSEGYGFAIAESLASSTPVVLYEPYTRSRSYTEWCIKDVNSFYVNTETDFVDAMHRYYGNTDLMKKMQADAFSTVREKINNSVETDLLGRFLRGVK